MTASLDSHTDSGVAEAFRMPEAARLSVWALESAALQVTEIELAQDGFGLTEPMPYQDAAMLAVQLKPIPYHEAITDDRAVPVHDVAPGDTLFCDLRSNPRANILTPSHSLHFVLPRALLDGIAEAIESHPIDQLFPPTGAAVHDAQLARLARSILPALRHPDEATALFSSHFMLALGLYVCWRYGGMQAPRQPKGQLCRLQTRLAKEYISANLGGAIELGELARVCGMPAQRFAVAFRETLGMAPYQWLTLRRLDLGKSLLRQRNKTIEDAAALSGFIDIEHFVRTFTDANGVSPSGWRSQMQ